MKFELLFDAGIFKKQMSLNYRRLYRRKIHANVLNLTIGIFLVTQILGPLAPVNIINFGIGCFFSLNAFVYFGIVIRRLYLTKKLVRDYVYEQIPSGTFLWEFNDTYLNYKEPKFETIVEWELFQSFEIIDTTIFLLSYIYANPFIISEDEIGKAEFNKLIVFLKGKVKPGKTVGKYLIQG